MLLLEKEKGHCGRDHEHVDHDSEHQHRGTSAKWERVPDTSDPLAVDRSTAEKLRSSHAAGQAPNKMIMDIRVVPGETSFPPGSFVGTSWASTNSSSRRIDATTSLAAMLSASRNDHRC
jgi:hypothetical protein